MTRKAAGCSHAKAPPELWMVRNAANASTAPRTGRRAGVSTQRRCDTVRIMRPVHIEDETKQPPQNVLLRDGCLSNQSSHCKYNTHGLSRLVQTRTILSHFVPDYYPIRGLWGFREAGAC